LAGTASHKKSLTSSIPHFVILIGVTFSSVKLVSELILSVHVWLLCTDKHKQNLDNLRCILGGATAFSFLAMSVTQLLSVSDGPLARKKLQDIVFLNGCPDDGTSRPMLWRLLLHYLSWDKREWPAELKRNRDMYKQFEKDLIINPFEEMFESKTASQSTPKTTTAAVAVAVEVQSQEIEFGLDPLSNLMRAAEAAKAAKAKEAEAGQEAASSSSGFCAKKPVQA
jgi:hypothetical protein